MHGNPNRNDGCISGGKQVQMNSLIHEIRDYLLKARGMDLFAYQRSMVEKAIFDIMETMNLDNPESYMIKLRETPSECDRILEKMWIRVSSFFRNPAVFEMIAQRVLPIVMDLKTHKDSREIRVWCAGCATGEEAYSMAILLKDAVSDDNIPRVFHIFATDVDRRVLKIAERGIYSRKCLENTKLRILDKYFIAKKEGTPFFAKGNEYEIRPMIRRFVRFSVDDVTSAKRIAPADSVFGSFDIILCRNVLIYFDFGMQGAIIEKFRRALNSGGFLVLGEAECMSREAERQWVPFDRINRIYQKPRKGCGEWRY